ncbi:MAG: TatD family hydrolase [Peptococcaceae bacterium]|jgi:TatD DNase family protein|nr:TatD family hydrolase [Peptococcaceae bacterium]
MIWDTHAHLDDKKYSDDLGEVRQRAKDAGVTRILNVGYDLAASERSVKMAHSYPEFYAAVGVHPHDVKATSQKTWDRLQSLAKEDRVLAWGEIGLDFYRDLSPRPKQREAFIQQIELADAAGLPVIIHSRDADEESLKIVKAHRPQHGGVFHCYSGSWETAKILLDLGFYLSFAGPLTYRNARHLPEVAQKVPLDRYFVETDAPYLTPEPHRGKRNEPAFVREVAKKLAEFRGITLEEAAAQSWKNAECLFRLTQQKLR